MPHLRPLALAALLACASAGAQTPTANLPTPSPLPARPSVAAALPTATPVAVTATPANADLPAPRTLAQPQTLPQAVEQAVLRNPEVLSRYHNYQSAQAEQDALRGGLLPRIDAQAYAGRERSNFEGGPTSTYNRPGASLQLRQILFDGNGVRSETRRAGYTKLSRYYELLSSSDEIALETVRAYLDVQRYRELELLARDNWAFHQETLQQLERRTQAGVGRRVDLELAVGRTALAQSNWLTDTSNLHDVGQRYQRLVGQPPAAALAAAPEIGTLPTADTVLLDATRRNPLFQLQVANIRAARADMDARKAAYAPTIELRASTGRDRTLIATNQTGNSTNSTVQVLLNYNLFRGGSDSARARQAQENLYAAQDARDNACRNVRQTTSIAFNDTRRLREQLGYLEQHRLSSEKAREAYRQQFDIGQRSLLDLLDTENELFQARRAVVTARYDLVLAGWRVLQQTNAILPAVNQQPLAPVAPDEASQQNPAEDEAVRCSTEVAPPQMLDTAGAMAARPPLPPTPGSTLPAAPTGAQVTPSAALPGSPVSAAVPAGQPSGPTAAAAMAVTAAAPAIERSVRAWAAAWAAKDVPAYLASYSSRFTPQQGSLQAWKAQRTQRVGKAGDIQVDIEDLRVRPLDGDTAEATFVQRYRAEGMRHNDRKTLTLVREDGAWKISREVAQPM